MDITSIIDLLPLRARKQVLRSLVGFLNQSIIGYARAHLRQTRFALPDEVPTIDLYNEMRARMLEDEQHRQAIADMGFTAPEPAIVNLQRLTILRDWFATEALTTNEGVAFDPIWDVPFSLEESLDWTIGRAPSFDEAELKRLAEAVGRKFEVIKAAAESRETDDRKDLVANRDAILDLYQTCHDANLHTRQFIYKVDGVEKVIDIPPIEQREGIEALIDELPILLRWRIGIKLYDLIVAASERMIKLMVRPGGRGAREAAADIRLIDATQVEHYKHLVAFDKKHGRTLDEIAGRGQFVAVLPEPLEEPVVAAMEAQRAQEDAARAAGGKVDEIRLDTYMVYLGR